MVNSVDGVDMFDKEADTTRMSRSEDQNRGFDKKLPFCDVLTTTEHFVQVLVLKYTKKKIYTMNGQLGGRCRHV